MFLIAMFECPLYYFPIQPPWRRMIQFLKRLVNNIGPTGLYLKDIQGWRVKGDPVLPHHISFSLIPYSGGGGVSACSLVGSSLTLFSVQAGVDVSELLHFSVGISLLSSRGSLALQTEDNLSRFFL
jgi:hypothetical protein